jgi:tetratricopeptide (TPR) repeat protein
MTTWFATHRFLTLALLAGGLVWARVPVARAAAASSQEAPATIALSPASGDSSLPGLAAQLRAHPDDQATAKALRQRARRAGQLDSAITILKGILNGHPEAQAIRMQLALAHVDRLPAPPALDLPAQAVIASQATRLFGELIAADPEQWAPRYARGMTHLLFPLPSRHYEPAADDFLKLLELQRTLPPTSHFVHTFVAIGDAYVMDQQLEAARAWWQAGKKAFPADPELADRLAIDSEALLTTIAARYGFDQPFDTDREFLDLVPR